MITIEAYNSSSSGNCYCLTSNGRRLLIEAGIKFRDIAKNIKFEFGKVDGCLVSHEHDDHGHSVKELIKHGIDVYMSEGTKAALGKRSDYACIIVPHHEVLINHWRVMPFRTEHDATEPLGFLITDGEDKLVFITDSYFCRWNFNELTKIMIECNYDKRILDDNLQSGALTLAQAKRLLKSHFSLQNVEKFLMANDLSKVSEIHLLHLSAMNSNPDIMKKEIQALTGKPVYVCKR